MVNRTPCTYFGFTRLFITMIPPFALVEHLAKCSGFIFLNVLFTLLYNASNLCNSRLHRPPLVALTISVLFSQRTCFVYTNIILLFSPQKILEDCFKSGKQIGNNTYTALLVPHNVSIANPL